MARGIRRQRIFDDDYDQQVFMEGMKSQFQRFNCTVHAYCLMTNHFHILLETDDVHISDVMKPLLRNYSLYYNKRKSYRGHLFEDRYASNLVETDAYFLQVGRYIHLNPVKARMAVLPDSYKWSSYRTIIGMKDDGITKPDRTMAYFKDIVAFTYRDFMEDASGKCTAVDEEIQKSIREDSMGLPC